MNGVSPRTRLLLACAALAMLSLSGAVPLVHSDDELAITGVVELADPVARYGRFEADISLSLAYANPFDAGEISVDVTFTAPGGAQKTAPAFWFQDYEVRPGTETWEEYDAVGSAGWRVRFAPAEVGTYSYSIAAEDGAGRVATPAVGTFESTASSSKGFVRRDGLDLRYDSGALYFPTGHNLAFEDGNPSLNGTHYYEPLLASFGAADESWARVWMTDFNRSALEWGAGHWSGFYGGVGRYSLQSAWRLDEILELAGAAGVQVQLVLSDHGQFNTRGINQRWDHDGHNAYSDAAGGPVPAAQPELFFTDATARELFKRRLRYLIARYGAYTNLLAWELFNEVQLTGSPAANPDDDPDVRADVVAWHAEMGGYLESNDPFDHPVTSSSHPSQVADGISALPQIDLVQLHLYATPPALHDQVVALQTAYGKPVIAGEFGLDGSPENGFDPTAFGGSQADREHLLQGTHVHNAAWSAALSRSGAMTWWWGTYVAADAAKNRTAPEFPLNERVFPPLATYLADEDWAGMSDASLTTSAGVVAVGLASATRARMWVRDALNEYGTGERPGDLAGRVVAGAEVTIAGMAAGDYKVELHATYGGGGLLQTIPATATGGTLTVALPDFTRDVALKVEPAVSCVRQGTTLSVSDFSSSVSIVRSGQSLLVTGCGAATVTDTDTIEISGSADAEALTVDLSGGPIAHPDGSEILVDVDFGAGTDALTVIGGAGKDQIRLGQDGVNLNTDGDVDLVWTAVLPATVRGGGANDIISGGGLFGTGDAYPLDLVIEGEAGNDKLTGGYGDDVLDGGSGTDQFFTARTPDGADTYRGGSGNDLANFGARLAAVDISLDGVANDGEGGEGDDVEQDVEKAVGGKGNDVISDGGQTVANNFKGGRGNDTLEAQDGVGGNDKFVGGVGTDVCSADPGDVKSTCEG